MTNKTPVFEELLLSCQKPSFIFFSEDLGFENAMPGLWAASLIIFEWLQSGSPGPNSWRDIIRM